MKQIKSLIHRFKKQSDGVTAIEYGLIAAGISLAIMVGVRAVGTTQSENFERINGALSSTPNTSTQSTSAPSTTKPTKQAPIQVPTKDASKKMSAVNKKL